MVLAVILHVSNALQMWQRRLNTHAHTVCVAAAQKLKKKVQNDKQSKTNMCYNRAFSHMLKLIRKKQTNKQILLGMVMDKTNIPSNFAVEAKNTVWGKKDLPNFLGVYTFKFLFLITAWLNITNFEQVH